MHASLHTAALLGANASLVEVQVDLSLGLPGFHIVGLPDSACNEARVRVQTAIKNSGFVLPQKRITVNLAPADLRKEGASFDLAIAVGILSAAGLLQGATVPDALFAGELSLAGQILPVRGVLPLALEARRTGATLLFVPAGNASEATLVQGLTVIPVRSLQETAAHITGDAPLAAAGDQPNPPEPAADLDLSDVRGQLSCKRALEIAAAGSHNALLIGPPGSGKSLLSRRFPTLLPDLSFEEALEATCIWSAAGLLRPGQGLLARRPFRAPHHTISTAGLIGGGSPPKPGEIALAHHGTLFLDEIVEFNRSTLEALRQPLEDGEVTIVRARGAVSLPARFTLLGAMNPCPCGFANSPGPKKCFCTGTIKEAYRRRLSGPLLDRFDLHIEAPALTPDELCGPREGETSAQVRARVQAARLMQERRYARLDRVHANGHLRGPLLRDLCDLTPDAARTLRSALGALHFSARAHDRVLKVARTIADLEGSARVGPDHVNEAVQFRSLDRSYEPEPPELPPIFRARADDTGASRAGPQHEGEAQ